MNLLYLLSMLPASCAFLFGNLDGVMRCNCPQVTCPPTPVCNVQPPKEPVCPPPPPCPPSSALYARPLSSMPVQSYEAVSYQEPILEPILQPIQPVQPPPYVQPQPVSVLQQTAEHVAVEGPAIVEPVKMAYPSVSTLEQLPIPLSPVHTEGLGQTQGMASEVNKFADMSGTDTLPEEKLQPVPALGDTSSDDGSCNSEQLRKILLQNIEEDLNASKRFIQLAAEQTFGGSFDVICANNDFSYVTNTDLYCQETKGDVSCYAYKQLQR